MIVVGPSEYDTLLKKMNLKPGNGEVQVVPFPATVAYVRGYALFKEKLTAAALNFLEFATSSEGVRPWDTLGQTDFVPARTDLLGEWLKAHPGAEGFTAGLEGSEPPPVCTYNQTVVSYDAMADFDKNAAKIFEGALKGEISPEAARLGLQALEPR
jgi:ABC-type glycerol-3-phosphate transport system substrate-binding protein